MEFLQQPSRVPHITGPSKSREKDRRRASREQDEISTFFKPVKTSPAETSPNATTARSSNHIGDKRSMYISQGIQAEIRDQSIDPIEQRYLGFHPGLSSDQFPASRGRTPSTRHVQIAPDTTSRFSAKTRTGVTWSETQISPGVTVASRQRDFAYQHQASPTPEPIRRALENTGIFKNTGREEAPGLRSSPTESTPAWDDLYQWQASRELQRAIEESNRTLKLTTSQSRPASRPSKLPAISSSEIIDQTPRLSDIVERGNRAAIERPVRKPDEKHAIGGEGTTGEDREIVVEQYDPNLGWYQHGLDRLEKTSAATHDTAQSMRESNTTPLTRQQIAENARIKRPATTLPVIKASAEPIVDHGNIKAASERPTSAQNAQNAQTSHPINIALIEPFTLPALVEVADSEAAHESLAQPSLDENTEGSQALRLDEARVPTSMNNDHHDQQISSTSEPPPLGRHSAGPSPGNVIAVSQNNIPRPGHARLQAPFSVGLPVRGPSLTTFGLPPHPSRDFPGPEPMSLYLGQVQRQHTTEGLAFDENIANNQADENLASLHPKTIPHLEDCDYYMLQEEPYHSPVQHLIDEELEELEYIAEDYIHRPRVWQPTAPSHDMVEDFETWAGPDIGNSYELFDQPYDMQALVEAHGLDKSAYYFEDQLAEGVHMSGFWRRRY